MGEIPILKKKKKKNMGEIYTLALKYDPEISNECF